MMAHEPELEALSEGRGACREVTSRALTEPLLPQIKADIV
jgi:hypothetical protein